MPLALESRGSELPPMMEQVVALAFHGIEPASNEHQWH
jgi:hypothetical protein